MLFWNRNIFDFKICFKNEWHIIEQIRLANKYELPIIIHSRESQEDVEKIAEIKGLSVEEVIKNTTQNAYKVYGIDILFIWF